MVSNYIDWRMAGDRHVGELFRDGVPVRRPLVTASEPSTYIVANRNRAHAEADVAIIMRMAREDGAI